MQRNEVEAIFQERKEKLLQGITPSTNPIAIIMGQRNNLRDFIFKHII